MPERSAARTGTSAGGGGAISPPWRSKERQGGRGAGPEDPQSLPLPRPRASETGSCPPAPGGTLSWCDDRLTSVPQPATPATHLPPPGLGLQISRALPGCALEGVCKNLGKGPKERRENWKEKTNKCWEEVGIRLRHFLAQLPHLGSGTPASRASQLGPAGTREKGFFSRRVQGKTVKICLGWPIFSFAPIKRKSPRNSIKATLAKALFEA